MVVDNNAIGPTNGFNCEVVVGNRETFNVWDISGDPLLRSYWFNYINNIYAYVVIYVINVNEPIERLRENKRVLQSLMKEYRLQESNLVVIFNNYRYRWYYYGQILHR